MKHFLFLAIGLCLFCACRKSESIQPKTVVVYPHSDQFSGTMHVHRIYDLVTPPLNFDSAYTQIFEVVYLDSSRVFLNYFYWDYQGKSKNGVMSYSPILTSTSSISTISDQSQFNMKVGYKGLAIVSKDSLLVKYPDSAAPYNYVTTSFAGKKK